MNKLTLFLIISFLAVLGFLGAPAAADPAIMIQFDNDGCPIYARDKADGGNGSANPCPATGTQHSDAACRSPGDTVVWKRAGTGEFKIVNFPYPVTYTSPPYQATSEIPAGNFNVEIKYTISNDDGSCVLDPRLIIGNTFFILDLDEQVQPRLRTYTTE